jgi:hypothetical protein
MEDIMIEPLEVQLAWSKLYPPKSVTEHVAWIGEYRTCEVCSEDTVDITGVEDTYHEDESGFYHYECWEKYSEQEASYYLGLYRQEKATMPAPGGYEWGDPKNPDYVEWAIEQADTRE